MCISTCLYILMIFLTVGDSQEHVICNGDASININTGAPRRAELVEYMLFLFFITTHGNTHVNALRANAFFLFLDSTT